MDGRKPLGVPLPWWRENSGNESIAATCQKCLVFYRGVVRKNKQTPASGVADSNPTFLTSTNLVVRRAQLSTDENRVLSIRGRWQLDEPGGAREPHSLGWTCVAWIARVPRHDLCVLIERLHVRGKNRGM